MNSVSSNISLFVYPCKKIADISVTFSVECKLNSEVLNKFKSATCSHRNGQDTPADKPAKLHGTDMTATAYAWYQAIENNLTGNPLSVQRTRVGHVTCGSQGGCFNIVFNTQGSLTYLKKCLTFIIKLAKIGSLYSGYDKNMKMLRFKPDRAAFNKCANMLAASLSKKIDISAVGKINTTKDKIDTLAKYLSEKFPKHIMLKPEGKWDGAEDKTKCMFPEIKCSGVSALLLDSYIKDIAKLPTHFDGDKLIIYSTSWETKKKALKDKTRMNTFIKRKYAKLEPKNHLPGVVAYMASAGLYADAPTVKRIATAKHTAETLARELPL